MTSGFSVSMVNSTYTATKSYSVLHINARSLLITLENHEFNFIAVTETWLTSNTTTYLLDIDGNRFIHCDINSKRVDSVAIYVKCALRVLLRPDLSNRFVISAECLFIEVIIDS